MNTALRSPPPLLRGDAVAVISPSGPVLTEHLQAGLDLLTQWGLEPITCTQTYARSHARPYLAGDDAVRLDALHQALHDPHIKGILFARGGYGAMRLLPHLDARALHAHPKILAGFSDITALLSWGAHCAQITTLHAPVVKSLGRHLDDPDHPSVRAMRDALFGARRGGFTISELRPNTSHRAPVTAQVFGGNLSLLQALLATPYSPDLNRKILILEDVSEQDYRLDRLLTSLRLSTRAHSPAAIVLGEHLDCAGVYIDRDGLEAFIASLAAEFGCPVVSGFPASHGEPNIAFPIGAMATLDPGAGTLTFHQDVTG